MATVVWERVMEMTKWAQEKKTDPLVWSIEVSSRLNAAGVTLPSVELAHRLVSHICWENHVPVTWKFLEKAMEVRIVPPLLVLSLLSARVVPHRHPHLHTAAYALYIHLLNRHAFSLSSHINSPNYPSIMKSIHHVLRLSQLYPSHSDPQPHTGVVLVQFLFTIVWQLLEASLEDEGLLEHKSSLFAADPDDTMELDAPNQHQHSHKDGLQLHAKNTATAIELIARFLHDKVTSRILSLVQRNMPTHWGTFVYQLQRLAANSLVLRSLKHISPESFLPLDFNSNGLGLGLGPGLLSSEWKTTPKMKLSAVLAASAVHSHNDSWSSLWLPIDLILEDAMDGDHVMAASAVELLTGLVKALHAVNGTAWHNAFLGLWIAALRLVQRERDPSEGPVPRLDTCLCMLLCITTLVVANIIEEEEGELIEEAERSPTNLRKDKLALGKRREELVTSLQLLGDYEDLLNPPQPVIWVANRAAAKAIMFISGNSGYLEYMNVNDLPTNFSGNLWHLIIEACIARHLLDTSAYFWPGYVNAPCNQLPQSIPNHLSSWSSLMKGSPLTPPMVNILVATPASRYSAAS